MKKALAIFVNPVHLHPVGMVLSVENDAPASASRRDATTERGIPMGCFLTAFRGLRGSLLTMMMTLAGMLAMGGVEYTLDERGLASLAHEGRGMLIHPSDGALRFNAGPEWWQKHPGEAVREFDEGAQTVTHRYPWGAVSATYARVSDTELKMTVTVSNTTEEAMPGATVYLARMTYSQVPLIDSAIVAASEFSGGTFAQADAASMPPIVLLSYGAGRLLLFGHDMTSTTVVGVFPAEVGGLVNSAFMTMDGVAAGASRTEALSLRWGKEGDTWCSLGGDVLRNYQRANPMELVWPDRRPIGKTFLASLGNGEPDWDRNPNQWFMNAKDFDIRTEEGKEEFRTRVLKMADAAVAMAKAQNAQGVITWDIEGQRQGHVYYGDPRQMGAIAPEMEYKGAHEDTVADAYFKRFKEAGVRYGICVRPQRLYQTEGEPPTGGWWVQDEVTREEAMELLISKIDYAVKRWGVTLVYIDSDYAVTSHDYKTLFKMFPSVLLIPEWKKPLHYAYTAPLHSYFHFKDTGTPSAVRKIFSNKAFCVNFVDSIATAPESDREALVKSLKNGDVACINSWYMNPDITFIGDLYNKK